MNTWWSKSTGFAREEIAVFISGIVSMGIEILAGRVLAPEFGSTIYTWGSIIGVSLLALSLGYIRGGRTAKQATLQSLDSLLIISAVYIIFLTVFGDELLTLLSAFPVSPQYAAILPVLILFGPPTYFLGFISPYAVELSSKEEKGEASGHFYALGTIGSIIGAFGTTFVLIPWFAVSTIYVFFACLSVTPLIRNWSSWRSYSIVIFAVIGYFVAGTTVTPGNTIYEINTPYQDLRVSEEEGVRTLYLDGQQQSAMYINNTTAYPWTYTRYFHIPFLLSDSIDNVLFVGGGGFSGPKRFVEEGVSVDVVELDQGVIDTAKTYFNVSESNNLQIHTGDGRDFLQRTNKTFDVVFLDAYRKYKVPFHLTTKEFITRIYEKTTPTGMVFSNVIGTSSGPGSEFSRAQYKTINSVFDTTYYFPTSDVNVAQNIEIIGTKQPRITQRELLRRNQDYTRMDLSTEIQQLQQPNTSDVPILQDDYAPVESLLEPLISMQYVTQTR